MAKEKSSKRRAQNGKVTSSHQVSNTTSLAVADSNQTSDGETIPKNQLPEKEETETDSKHHLIGSPSLFDGSQDLETKLKELEARLKESDARLKESDARLKESDARLKESDARLKESDARLKESDARSKESDASLKECKASLKESKKNEKKFKAEAETAEAKAMEFKKETEAAEAKATKFEAEAKASKTKATKFEAEARTSKAETERFKAEVQKLQPAKIAFRDVRRAELRKSAQKRQSRLTQKRNETAHGGSLLGDFYVIQEDFESDQCGGNVLKTGFSLMYQLQYDKIAPHILDISQTTRAPILEALNIGANVKTLNDWTNRAANPLIQGKVKIISADYVHWLNLPAAKRSEPQLQEIKNKCREVISMYNKEYNKKR
jgi:chromosome segregation ATPase